MDKKEVVSTLNDLIETCKDGEKGFKTCAENIDSQQIKSTLSQRAQECAQGAQELQGLVKSLGGEAETSSSVSGTMHRGWIDIKGAVTGKDEAAVLNECERGEDLALESYRNALDKDLPQEIRSIVERQFHGVMRNHNQVKQMRNAARAS
jgi:uncharacterized protein (TIGR02284 family)